MARSRPGPPSRIPTSPRTAGSCWSTRRSRRGRTTTRCPTAGVARRLRLAPYCRMVLADKLEHSGPLQVRVAETRDSVFFENPRNTFRSGPAFVALSRPAEHVETNRGRFFGAGRDVARPALV